MGVPAEEPTQAAVTDLIGEQYDVADPPADEPNPENWKTEIAILMAEPLAV